MYFKFTSENRFCPAFVLHLLILIEAATPESHFTNDNQVTDRKTSIDKSYSATLDNYYMLHDERICKYPALIDLMSSKTLTGELIQKMCLNLPPKIKKRSRKRRKSRRPGRKDKKELNDRAKKKLDSLLKSTRCRPMRQMVDIDNPHPKQYNFMPCKVVVKRCSGCCQSQLMECVATKTKMKKFDVLKLFLHQTSRHHHKSKQTDWPVQRITVREDKACECKCKVKQTDCGPGQEYDAHNCHCKCPTESYRTCHHRKIWSQSHCKCICKEKNDCTTGMIFNHKTCECQ